MMRIIALESCVDKLSSTIFANAEAARTPKKRQCGLSQNQHCSLNCSLLVLNSTTACPIDPNYVNY